MPQSTESLTERVHLKEQYASQTEILKKHGLLESLSSGMLGIRGIDGKEYPLPTFDEVEQRFTKKETLLKKKVEQGFTRLLLVPFGQSVTVLLEKYHAALDARVKEGKLFCTRTNPDDPNNKPEPLTLINTAGPFWCWEGYHDADIAKNIVYSVKEFSEHHSGKTKAELLPENGGWHVLLVEDMPAIPLPGEAKQIGGRTQIDTKGSGITNYIAKGFDTPTAHEYLAAVLKESADPASPYVGEQGMTTEDQMMYAMTYLEETNEILDFPGCAQQRIAYQVGEYFPSLGYIAFAFWNKDRRQLFVCWNFPDDRSDIAGVRFAVAL